METCRGFVLAGGRSRRMGQDKGRLLWEGVALVRHQWQRLEGLVPPAVVLGGDYGDLGLPCVADEYPGEGPLGGILTALGQSPAALILAVDMPRVSTASLRALFETEGADAVVPRHGDGRIQPLAALYRATALPKLRAVFAGGTRRVVDALASLEVAWFDTPGDEFRAMNTLTEYEEALHL